MHLFGNKKFREQRWGMFFHRGKGKVGGAAVNRVHKRKVGVGSAVFTQWAARGFIGWVVTGGGEDPVTSSYWRWKIRLLFGVLGSWKRLLGCKRSPYRPSQLQFKRGFCLFSSQHIFKKILFILFFRERGRERERAGEKHWCVVASWAPPTGDLSRNPGMCPDRESNHLLFAGRHSVHWATPARASS